MKKAFLESKWWFYVPIISLVKISEITEWVMTGEKELDKMYRHFLILCITILQAIIIFKLFLFFIQ